MVTNKIPGSAFAGMVRYLANKGIYKAILVSAPLFCNSLQTAWSCDSVCLLDVTEGHGFVHKSTLDPEALISQSLILAQSIIAAHWKLTP